MMLPSRLGCPLSLKTPNMGNPGLFRLEVIWASQNVHYHGRKHILNPVQKPSRKVEAAGRMRLLFRIVRC